MTDGAIFWSQLHFELGQLPEYAEFRRLLAQIDPHHQTEPPVSKSEKHSKVIYRKLLLSYGELPHSARGGKRCSH
jgi:hypothetical protein